MFGQGAEVFDRIVDSTEIRLDEITDMPILAAYNYWDSLRGDAIGPPRPSFRLETLPPRLIPCLAVIDIIGPPLDYYYRFFGTAMAEAAGRELTGKRYYADKVEGYGFVNARLLPVLIERREPMVHKTIWESVRRVRLQTTTLRLPLSADGQTVNGAVTANDYKYA